VISFSEVDILDNTPLLDIKPYVKHFDFRKNVRSGWIDEHFKNKIASPKGLLL
jgi:tRNA (Thr-GGU) A37 N-methylase